MKKSNRKPSVPPSAEALAQIKIVEGLLVKLLHNRKLYDSCATTPPPKRGIPMPFLHQLFLQLWKEGRVSTSEFNEAYANDEKMFKLYETVDLK